ncbi:MAG TPA: phage major capsid protein [Casimicrobiaceae bacterium]
MTTSKKPVSTTGGFPVKGAPPARPRRNGAGAPEDVEDFIAAVFARASGEIWIASIPGDPDKCRNWNGMAYDSGRKLAGNLYYAISELKAGATKRVEKNWHALRVVLLDDIGGKVDAKKIPLRPTFRIETSPGNEQWGFVLDPPETNKTKAQRLLEAVKVYGATDKGGMNLVRYARLPGGVNGKAKYGAPFPVRFKEFAPDKTYSSDEIAAAFGIELTGARGRPANDMPPLPPSDDTMLPILMKAELLKPDAVTNDRGYLPICCPWAAEHSDDKTEAGYRPGGVFKCFHDHCALRTFDDLYDWLCNEKGLSEELEHAVLSMPGPRGGLLRALRRYVYARDVDRFVDLDMASAVTVEAFDRFEAANMRGYKPSKHLLEHSALRRVLPMVYLPGKAPLLELNETGRAVPAVNLWRTGPVPPADAAADATKLQAWLQHLEWLFPSEDERAIALNFITHLVQRRGKKINWMLVALAREEGTGRDTLLKPIRDILGIRNVASIDAEMLFSQFNDWELTELVCFSEADTTEHSRWAIYRALKSRVTTPPDTTRVNRKNIAAVEQLKTANYIMFTNDPAAVAFDKGSRRVCVVESPYDLKTVREYAATGVFKRLHALYADIQWLGLLHATVVGRLSAYMRRVPFRCSITREASVAASAWVEEGVPTPASDSSFDLVQQEAYKTATIVILSRDLLRFAVNPRPDVEQDLRSQLVRGIAKFFDAQFLDHTVAPVAATHPGAITWNASAVNSTGNTAAQILADLLSMVGKLVTDNAPFQSPFWIMKPSTAITLAGKYNTAGDLAFPDIRVNGGTLLGIPVLTTANSPAQITLLDASEMLLSDDGQAEISTTDKAALQMADNPSTGAQSMTSLWQENLWAIKAVREIAWQPAHFAGSAANSPIDFVPKCVTYMTVNY